MGTRHLIEVKIDGELKVSQYGQWDGYLSGQGAGIARFIHKSMDRGKFCSALRECRFIDEERDKSLIAQVEADEDWRKNYPHLSRDAGSDILEMIQNRGGLILKDSRDFRGESGCEYAYLIDMDEDTVTVTRGDDVAVIPFSRFTPELCKQEEEDFVFSRHESATLTQQPAPPGFPKLPLTVDGFGDTIVDANGQLVADMLDSDFSVASDRANGEAIVTAVNAYYRNADEQESPE